MEEVASTIVFSLIVTFVIWTWARDVWSSKRRLEILGTRLSPERVEALFAKHAVRRRDAHELTDAGAAVQPPSGSWVIELALEPIGDGCAGSVWQSSVILEPFPKQFPLTRVVRNGSDIARRKRAFKRALRRADPAIELRESRQIFLTS